MKNIGLCKKILIPVCGHIVNLDEFHQQEKIKEAEVTYKTKNNN
jgi:hypothetical protein